MIKYILWDFDGTLFDTSPARTYAMSKTMKELGYSVPLNIIDSMIRQSYDICIETLGKRYKYSPQDLHTKFLHYYAAIPCRNQILLPGAIEICSWNNERGGENYIITDLDPKVCQQFIHEHAVNSYFSGIFSLPHSDLHATSDLLEKMLNQYQLDPAVTLLVTPQERTIQIGRRAGLNTCLYGASSAMSAADWRIKNYNQLLPLLREGCYE